MVQFQRFWTSVCPVAQFSENSSLHESYWMSNFQTKVVPDQLACHIAIPTSVTGSLVIQWRQASIHQHVLFTWNIDYIMTPVCRYTLSELLVFKHSAGSHLLFGPCIITPNIFYSIQKRHLHVVPKNIPPAMVSIPVVFSTNLRFLFTEMPDLSFVPQSLIYVRTCVIYIQDSWANSDTASSLSLIDSFKLHQLDRVSSIKKTVSGLASLRFFRHTL